MRSSITHLAAGAPRRRWVATTAATLLALVAVMAGGAARATAAAGDCIDTFNCYSLSQAFNNDQPFVAHQQSFSVTTDLTGDTIQQSERRNCLLANGGLAWGNNSAWYRFDAGVNGSLAVSASANFPVMLVQYEASHEGFVDYTSNADLPSGQCTGQGAQESFDTPLSVHTNGPTFLQVLVGCGDSTPPTNANPCHQGVSAAGPVALQFTFTCTDSDSDGVCDTVDECPAVAAATATGCPAPPPSGPAPENQLATSIGRITTSGTQASVPLSCSGPAGQTCAGTVAFRARVRAHGPMAAQTLARASYAVAVGQKQTLNVSLDAAGRRLLQRLYRLRGTLTLTGPGSRTRSMTFAYPVLDTGIAEDNSHLCHDGRCTTRFDRLTLTQLSRVRAVTVTCRGGGCPFARHGVTPHGSQLALAPLFAGHRLTPGSVVTIRASAPGVVARVFTASVARTRVTVTLACLAPGAHATAACPA